MVYFRSRVVRPWPRHLRAGAKEMWDIPVRHTPECPQVMRLSSFFESVQTPARTHSWVVAHDVGGSSTDALAKALAEKIMEHRCIGTPHLFEAWRGRLEGGPQPTGTETGALKAFVRPVFGLPEEPQAIPIAHLEGCVAQYLWYFLSLEDLMGENVVRVEPPGFAVTDPGGDGLVIHRAWDGSMMFRLWEIKKNTASSPVSSTVDAAYQQLDARAAEYLARYTPIGQELTDPDIAEFYSRLPEFWLNAAPEAAAGVCVEISSDSIPRRCFSTFGRRFPRFTDPVRLMGMLTAITDLPEFVEQVRHHVWTGL